MTLRELRRILRPISQRVANSLARAVVQLVDDDKKLQLLQLGGLPDAPIDDAEHFQQYGFTSVPLEGAEAVVIFPNGDRSHPLVVAVDDRRYRPVGNPKGHVSLYHFTGAQVTFSEDGDIEAVPATGRKVLLGSATASDPPATLSDLNALKDAFSDWVVLANDGGGALKTELTTLISGGWPTGATKVNVE